MKGKGSLVIWLVVLAVFLAGSGYVGYRLWKRQKNRALAVEMQRWELKREVQLREGLSQEEIDQYLVTENENIDRYEVLRPVIDDLDLITYWGVADVDEAMVKLKECTDIRAGDDASTVLYVFSAKEKDMTAKLAEAILRSYESMRLRDSLRLPPPPPPGFQE